MEEEKSILIVDNDEGTCRSLELIFGEKGYVTETVRTGREALNKVKARSFNAAFLDIKLPDVEGIDLLGPLKEMHREMVIIMVTTYASLENAMQALNKGASAYIIKPVKIVDEIFTVFNEALEKQTLVVENKELWQKVQRELAERKLVEETLKKSEEKYRALFEDSRDAIVITDKWGKFVDLNRSALELFDYTREELMDMSIEELYSDPSEGLRFKREVDQKGCVRNFEVKICRKDGTEMTCEFTVSAKKGNDGSTVGYQGIIRDITERKKLEEQFFQSQKMEAIGRLAGGVAHDFNNLLTTIRGHADIMLMGLKGDNPLRSDLQEITRASDRAASLTRQLLAFSRRQVLQPKVLDLNGVIGDTEKMLRRLIGEDVKLVTTLEPEIGRVKVDPGQIEQVIMNLAVNARDAMPQGGKLTIETADVELDEAHRRRHVMVKPGPYVMLGVRDTGVGMDNKTQSRIFEPFFTTKEKGKGTGLGLSTVYGIIKQSGGYIWANSKPGQGTTFKIYLPRVEGEVEPVEKEGAPKDLIRGSETVLVVEDDEMVRNLATTILQRYGYSVLKAKNGVEAQRINEQHEGTIQLMVTDVVMPGMSGRELAEHMRHLQPDIKVLFITGYTDSPIVNQVRTEKGISLLQKPFTHETLARKVREVLDN